jgi:hypothetical protein
MAFFLMEVQETSKTTKGLVQKLAQYELLSFFCWVVCFIFWVTSLV